MSPLAWLLRGLVRAYQLLVSPILPPSCRFTPSCSSFAMEALARHGAVKGTWLAICRVARCHPWNDGGYDPVPEPKSKGRAGTPPAAPPDRTS
ncbi:membrane protein insertion efficiency factor YidD [Magnetospirillum sp. UT-4]|uniref:membrane protein insertion efficiency factor YidD n=1 Tax=Magnetospirillum sp. UT-4 TaxID=2681467 RepID=UPI001382FF4C|nr:membrane protein insertion efficiency factor YidD [Magnetospirillum sp. UT-4]CAA7624346.1 putative membrane protein insertion efficiency factor [Magnetospirillum sp. UT-4]